MISSNSLDSSVEKNIFGLLENIDELQDTQRRQSLNKSSQELRKADVKDTKTLQRELQVHIYDLFPNGRREDRTQRSEYLDTLFSLELQ